MYKIFFFIIKVIHGGEMQYLINKAHQHQSGNRKV